MTELKYFVIMRVEQKPYCHGGENNDEHIPMWDDQLDQDDDGTRSPDEIIWSPKNFPAGTKITVEEPICPKCNLCASLCMETDCDFNWHEWAENKYA